MFDLGIVIRWVDTNVDTSSAYDGEIYRRVEDLLKLAFNKPTPMSCSSHIVHKVDHDAVTFLQSGILEASNKSSNQSPQLQRIQCSTWVFGVYVHRLLPFNLMGTLKCEGEQIDTRGMKLHDLKR